MRFLEEELCDLLAQKKETLVAVRPWNEDIFLGMDAEKDEVTEDLIR